MQSTNTDVKVWDLFVRIGHWTLVAAFVIAYLTQEDAEDVHVAAGYWVAAYVAARIIWGFIGSRHARFADFIYGPRAVMNYLVGLFSHSAKRYLGHSPAGGAMVFALLFSLTATVVTGLMVEGAENEGPFAQWLGQPSTAAGTTQNGSAADETGSSAARESDDEGDSEGEEDVYEELHEVVANLTLLLVILHLLGVLASSYAHRENLIAAMISGRKRPLKDSNDNRQHRN